MPTTPSKAKRGKNATQEAANARIEKLRATAVNAVSMPERELVSADRPLTQKQRDFVRFWAQGETIMTASARAGYNDNGTYCYRLAKDPAILKLYQQEKAAYEEAAQMSRKKVMDMLIEAYEMAKITAEPASMVAAAREVGKMCGYYEPVKKQIDINISGNGVFARLNKLSDEDLLKLIEQDPNVIDAEMREVPDGEGEDE